jgi:DNA polymerase epsilon subunit 1
VSRDSYLPMGSRGLKAVTKYKLGYDPVEVNPEDMVRFASEQPQHMAAYSVSDAVATYYLYMKYVHNFIFSLATIIPMGPEDVLRKGSGTLCEMLLMVEAVEKGIICPNKQNDRTEKFHDNKLLQNETYVGGHVECLESGVFRDDIPTKFELDPTAFDELIDNVDRDLTFALEVENGVQRSDCENYDEVRSQIIEQLEMLRDTPNREEEPVVYHLDVAAMYPNIILTNRLQPTACAAGTQCPTCEYHLDYDKVHRQMPWTWRGDMYPASRSECASIRHQVEHEFAMERAQERDMLNRMRPGEAAAYQREQRSSRMPNREERCELEIKKRLKDYCQKVYKKTKITVVEERVACVCQRENPFYVDTVRAFRDRRYVYKGLTKKWGKEVKKLTGAGDELALMEAKNKSILYDSLQLAHKCILNSFYGYVMRRGARWYSMPMAAVVTRTGAMLITQARELVERVGRPLELDTDGIWCILPSSFPENFRMIMKDGSKYNISYPGTMLNTDVHKNYTNHQYQTLVDPRTLQYATHSECSIYFEVDGPYRCMVLPASTEKDRLLKKRYAVFNFDGSLAELKGFELKRRGELSIIKVFQSSVFAKFLNGDNLQECYENVGAVADEWLDVLHSRGENMEDTELIDLISENRSMSRRLEDYGNQRSTAITVAKRLGDLLGMDQVQDSGLNCKLLIARFPLGGAITERALPVAIFESEPAVMRHYLRKWCKDGNMSEEAGDFDIRNLIDWDYYVARLNSCIQKIITIPAALQRIRNPVPRCVHPDWLLKVVREKLDPFKQKSMTNFFTTLASGEKNILKDLPAADQLQDNPSQKNSSRSSSSSHSHSSHSRGGGARIGETSALLLADEEEEDTSTFDGWLKHRKQQWKLRRLRKKRLRGNADRGDKVELLGQEERASALRGGMGSYMRANADALAMADYHWQVLEIRPISPAGTFRVFALTGPHMMEHFDVIVPRTLYTNSRVAMEGMRDSDSFQTRKVARVLPRAHRQLHLYEIQLAESRFKRNEKKLSNFLTHPDLEGVYELGVPLLLRSVLELGCVVKPNKKVIKERRKNKTPTTEPYRLDQLEMLTTAKHEYLEPRNVNYTYRRVYLFHSKVDARRATVALCVVDPIQRDAHTGDTCSEVTATVHVWLVDPSGNGARPNLRRLWKEYTGDGKTMWHNVARFLYLVPPVDSYFFAFTVPVCSNRISVFKSYLCVQIVSLCSNRISVFKSYLCVHRRREQYGAAVRRALSEMHV